ncbi:hypothetical protein D9611_006114 [Ephemerocybe angulata]|uniref:Uncharacterized protein n=1 Tax=Ephemerocybe angulata TaxID=980116 RepID=A0A8H5FLS3_9AGAR|nr:hypothetical protein D9611_006114 [Tulosesus angulatus]
MITASKKSLPGWYESFSTSYSERNHSPPLTSASTAAPTSLSIPAPVPTTTAAYAKGELQDLNGVRPGGRWRVHPSRRVELFQVVVARWTTWRLCQRPRYRGRLTASNVIAGNEERGRATLETGGGNVAVVQGGTKTAAETTVGTCGEGGGCDDVGESSPPKAFDTNHRSRHRTRPRSSGLRVQLVLRNEGRCGGRIEVGETEDDEDDRHATPSTSPSPLQDEGGNGDKLHDGHLWRAWTTCSGADSVVALVIAVQVLGSASTSGVL